MANETFYIGLDQSSKKTGFAILDSRGKLLDFGVKSIGGESVVQRGSKLMEWFEEQFADYMNSKIIVGLEDIQGSFQNYKTVVTLSKILGIFEFYLYQKGINYQVIPVNTWRKTCGIKGRKREEQKANAIKKVEEKYEVKTEEDAAEAILITQHLLINNGWG